MNTALFLGQFATPLLFQPVGDRFGSPGVFGSAAFIACLLGATLATLEFRRAARLRR